MGELDPRLHAFRPDLADRRLKSQVKAERYADGTMMEIAAPLASIHRQPRFDAMQVTQALMGEKLRVFESREGWAWGRLERDGYVGYLAADAMSDTLSEPTHRIAVPATFAYPAPDLKSQPAVMLPMNAMIAVAGGDEKYARLAGGRFVFARHLKPFGEWQNDFVAVAELLRHVPYYWGGKSVRGLDCSGLIQLALEACGIACPRDSDMQERDLGVELPIDDLGALKRGDLVFWDGHAGIMTDGATLLHANGHHMLTVTEPLREAAGRIAKSYGRVTSIKRL
ncbi:MAG: C40 family peptidase [Hyphomicrobiales bacterium]